MNATNRCKWLLRMAAMLFVAAPSFAQQNVSVYVWQENLADKTRYHYRVTNNTHSSVVSLNVGDHAAMGVWELQKAPHGWDPWADIPSGDVGVPIPAGSVSSPTGWRAHMLAQEDNPGMTLEWAVTDNAWQIAPSQTLRGFSVLLSGAGEAVYRTGHFNVVLSDATMSSSRLQPDTLEAPVPTAVVTGTATLCTPDSTTIQATLTGNGPWRISWSDGVTQSGIAFSPAVRTVVPTYTRSYFIAQLNDSNRAGTDTGSADITVNNSVNITTHPHSQTIRRNTTAALTVSAGGTTPLTYQWFKGTTGDTTVPVGTNSRYTTPKLSATTNYWVRVTNTCGSVNSNTAVITVQ